MRFNAKNLGGVTEGTRFAGKSRWGARLQKVLCLVSNAEPSKDFRQGTDIAGFMFHTRTLVDVQNKLKENRCWG